MKKVLFLFISLLLSGCVHSMQFTNFDTGEALNGEFNEVTRDMSVVMPDGEVLSGKYSPVSSESVVTFGTSFGRVGRTPMLGSRVGVVSGGVSTAYALLKSPKSKLMMEIIVQYSGIHGYGEARTNDGRNYRVQF